MFESKVFWNNDIENFKKEIITVKPENESFYSTNLLFVSWGYGLESEDLKIPDIAKKDV